MSDRGSPSPEWSRLPIGMFDSGVGGLTVLQAFRRELPGEDILYLGDTARLPYGTKSPETVTRYALQIAEKLVARGIKMLVVACNTVSAVALEALAARWPELPVVGVVIPGAKASCAASHTGRIAVLATRSTIQGGAYHRAIRSMRPESQITGIPCPLFVSLAEEGLLEGPIVEAIARRYLDPVFSDAAPPESTPDCLVLACTHFPLLKASIRAVVGPAPAIVDSAQITALTVKDYLKEKKLLCPDSLGRRCVHYLTTDDPARFAETGAIFLGKGIAADAVELVDL